MPAKHPEWLGWGPRARAPRARRLISAAVATNTQLPLNAIADLVADNRAGTGLSSSVYPRVASACIVAMGWGLNVLETRWLEALDLDEIPNDQVATIIQAMLAAGE
jgi:hypothetical protein